MEKKGEMRQMEFVARPAGSTSRVGFNAVDSRGVDSVASAFAPVNVAAGPPQHDPTATGGTYTKAVGESTPLTSLFSYSDLDNDILSFALRDREVGGRKIVV